MAMCLDVNRPAERQPQVSVIIAVKNSARFLVECLNSVAAQTFTSYEIIVVDGHSVDATESIARSYDKVRFIQQTGTGFADAWNCGMRVALGEYFAFIDSDDRWVPDKLQAQINMLESDRHLDAVIGKVLFFVEPGDTPPSTFSARVLGRDHVGQMPGTLLARRALFERIGDWGEGWTVANDLDWFLKAKDSSIAVGVVDALVLHKRVHNRNFSYSSAEDKGYHTEILRLLHDSIVRKRGNKALAGDNNRPQKDSSTHR